MSTAEGRLLEISNNLAGLTGKLACPPSVQPEPGQYLMAARIDSADPLPVVLFPGGLPGPALDIASPFPAEWAAGMPLRLRGPLGRGFRLPPNARRVALVAIESSPILLRPLALKALQQGASVALHTVHNPGEFPIEVEILPPDLLPDSLTWADYLACCLPPAALRELRRLAALPTYARFQEPSQALVTVPMPCGGAGRCEVCSVATDRTWRRACEHGPVFDLNTLELP